jgi:hypothetical protein
LAIFVLKKAWCDAFRPVNPFVDEGVLINAFFFAYS